jgi:hypothetical protein
MIMADNIDKVLILGYLYPEITPDRVRITVEQREEEGE